MFDPKVGHSIRQDFCGCGLYVELPFPVTRIVILLRGNQNAKVGVMGSGQLSQVMTSVSKYKFSSLRVD